jgi:2-methylaconitate cis-trans-isomerase PrpF
LRWLHGRIHEHREGLISKYALIKPSPHPMFDLDYRFVQMVPGEDGPFFDFWGSCGHSILASITVASRWGWLHGSSPGMRSRVRVLNNQDTLVCETDEANRRCVSYTAHFVQPPNTRLHSLLLTGELTTNLETPLGEVEASLVSAGNPYVFVDARAALGFGSSAELFSAGQGAFDALQSIRRAASRRLGWDPGGVFPKIAAIGAYDAGRLAVRAISVPSWHPTLALTGVVCLGAAASIGGTVVARLAREAGCEASSLEIETAGGRTRVACATTGTGLDDLVDYMSVSNKRVSFIGAAPTDDLLHIRSMEVPSCLPART